MSTARTKTKPAKARKPTATAAPDDTEDGESGEVLVRVPPADLVASPFHHRTRWGDMKALTKSVAEQGLVEPIVGRYIQIPGEARQIEIVVGHRRQDAAIGARLELVPVVIRELLDVEVIQIQATENMEREGLHPLDEAAYFDDLMAMGHDVRMLARMFTRTPAYIRARLSLLKLCKYAKAAFAKDQISEASAMLIARLPLEDQQRAAVDAVINKILDHEDELAAWIRHNAMISLADVAWSLDDRAMPGGPCTGCAKRTATQADLFAPIAGKDDLCADAACWRGKMDHAHALAVQAQPDATVVTADPSRVFLPLAGTRPVVTKASGYVDSAAECPHVTGKTWGQVVAAAELAPSVHIAQDQQHRPRVLFRESEIAGVVRRAARDETPAMTRAAAEVDPARAQAAAATKGRKAKLAEILRSIVKTPDEVSPAEEVKLLAIAIQLCATKVTANSTARLVAVAANVVPETFLSAVENLAADDADPRALARILIALVVAEVGVDEDPPAAVRAIADHYEINLSPV